MVRIVRMPKGAKPDPQKQKQIIGPILTQAKRAEIGFNAMDQMERVDAPRLSKPKKAPRPFINYRARYRQLARDQRAAANARQA